QLLRQDKPSSAPGQDTHQPTLRSTSKGVAQSGGGRQRHFYANRRRDATRRSSFTPPCQHCAPWPRSHSETCRGTRKKLQRRHTGHPPDTLHPICRRLRGVQQYMGRHTTMQRGYPGMVERHGARTERRQNTVRPHPRAKGGVQWKRGFRLFGLHDQAIPCREKLVKIQQVIQDNHKGQQKQHSNTLWETSRHTQQGASANRGSDNLCAERKDYRLDSLLSQSKQCRKVSP